MGTSTTDPVRNLAVTSVKIDRDKLDSLRAIGKAQHRTVSQQLRFLIDQCIAEAEMEKAA